LNIQVKYLKQDTSLGKTAQKSILAMPRYLPLVAPMRPALLGGAEISLLGGFIKHIKARLTLRTEKQNCSAFLTQAQKTFRVAL
jgi:hypothetical protein